MVNPMCVGGRLCQTYVPIISPTTLIILLKMVNMVDILQEIIFYFIRKLDKKSFILIFGQFDHLVLLNKLI
jgi:hypothetical protein